MATKTISELPSSAIPLTGSELYEATQVSGGFPVSVKVRGRNIAQVPTDFIKMKLDQNLQAHQEGLMEWDNVNHTVQIHNDESDMRIQVGQETIARVKNETGETILNGTPVAYGGVCAGCKLPLIVKAKANAPLLINSVSVTTHDIPDDSIGYVTKRGVVRDFDTSAFSPGDIVYVSVSAGIYTVDRPVSPR